MAMKSKYMIQLTCNKPSLTHLQPVTKFNKWNSKTKTEVKLEKRQQQMRLVNMQSFHMTVTHCKLTDDFTRHHARLHLSPILSTLLQTSIMLSRSSGLTLCRCKVSRTLSFCATASGWEISRMCTRTSYT